MPYENDDDMSDSDLFITVPSCITDNHTNVYSAISTLCYGTNGSVDILELCGGTGGITHAAFRRGMSSGGNLDLTTQVDLGNPTTQKAVLHYLNTCNVLVTILQPMCRTTGPTSYFNYYKYYDTWVQTPSRRSTTCFT